MNEAKIFVDANYFLALYNPVDDLHQEAKRIARRLGRTGELITSNYIFSEIVTIFSQRVGRAEAITLGEALLNSDLLKIVQVNESLHAKSWEIFRQIKKKNMSFVDCSSLCVMQFFGIRRLLSFDRTDFSGLQKKFGYRLL
jgi:predicted nucleic acid-binding protein